MKHNFDLGDTVEDVSAPKKASTAKGSKSPSTSAKGTPKKDDKKAGATTTKAKKAAPKESTRTKRARVPTNFYLVQSSFDTSNDRHRQEPINLASDEDDDDDDNEDDARPAPKKAARSKAKKDSEDEDDTEEDARPAPKKTARSKAKKDSEDEDDDENDGDDDDDDDEDVEEVDEPVSKRQRVTSRSNPVKAVQPLAKAAKKDAKKVVKKQDAPVKKVAPLALAKKSAAPAPASSQRPKETAKPVVAKAAKKDSTAELPSAPAASLSAGAHISTGLSEAALNANTKQSKVLAAEMKAFTNAINSATMLISTLWEQYQEVKQKDMELREAALKVAQAQLRQHDEIVDDEATQQDDEDEEKAAAAAVAVAMAVEDEEKDDSTEPNPLLL